MCAYDPQLTDGHITLWPINSNDYDAHFAGEDAEIIRWLSKAPATPDGLHDYLKRCEKWWADDGPFYNFGIRVGPDDVLAGTMDVQSLQDYLKPGQVNLSYGLYPHWRGQGHATAAVNLACQYAGSKGFTEAIIRTEPDNTASAAVAKRAGFQYLHRDASEPDMVLNWYARSLLCGCRHCFNQHCSNLQASSTPVRSRFLYQ